MLSNTFMCTTRGKQKAEEGEVTEKGLISGRSGEKTLLRAPTLSITKKIEVGRGGWKE